ncbi:MAG: hypothetical protein A3J38_08155 [Gammaproteobacteria bacterium RIFCSPHIGHO2_12_FULL_45_9]|nr:MAG: hypothetical protein A3J38_08155 [Gammaproteobacteria bacterium RIFCSPHIGHO2_12_FULL_45_9]
MNILVTGAAGFIGATLTKRLLARGDRVVGVDNLNAYYDPALKKARWAHAIAAHPDTPLHLCDIVDRTAMADLFATESFDRVVHLAAQAGVRYSLENPAAYIDSNLVGFGNILEGCRHHQIQHLVFASSSSVYGANTHMPFCETDSVNHPVSLYAATKKANELMAHTYAHLYGLPCTGLRFFTVYGPWGRPDMALFRFADRIVKGEPIPVYNEGKMQRDFTYIDDIVEGVIRVLDQKAAPDPTWNPDSPNPATSFAPYRIYNIGNHQPTALLRYIEVLEQALGRTAVKEWQPLQPGDVIATFADTEALSSAVGFAPSTPIEVGVSRFVQWYRAYYLSLEEQFVV